ncbi:MAG: PDZ domain-containing protein [Acidobacteriota bacterium]
MLRNRRPFALLFALALALPASLFAGDAADPTPKPSIEKRITVVGSEPGDVRTIVVDGDEDGEGGGYAYSFESGLGRGYLGVGLLDLTRELRAHFGVPADAGVMVSSVDKDSPAAKAGLEAGDIVTAVDGKPVRDSWGIGRAVRGKKTGDKIEIDVWHNGHTGRVTATAAERDRERIEVMPFPDREAMRKAREAMRDSMRVREDAMKQIQKELSADKGHLMVLRSEREAQLEKRLNELEKKLDELQKKLDKNNSK